MYFSKARFLAIVWTLLILFACLIPGNDIPDVSVPLIDKWVHLVLFGSFTILWLCARPQAAFSYIARIVFLAILYGCTIEILQGLLVFLGRSMDIMDAVADAIGSIIGLFIFLSFRSFRQRIR